MRKIFPYLLLILIILNCSCQKIITIDIPKDYSRLVIHAFLTPQERIEANISRTTPLLATIPEDLSVADAKVSVFENGNLLEQLVYGGEGNYYVASNLRPKAGNNYHFEVAAEGFEDLVTIAEKIPAPLGNLSYSFENNAIAAVNSGTKAGLFSWEVDPDNSEVAFYGINIRPIKLANEASSSLTWIVNFEEEFSNICGATTSGNSWIIPNACLQGSGSDVIQMGIETTYSSIDGPQSFTFLEVRLQSISPSYYNYLKNETRPDGIDLAFSSPDTLFTNAIGGFGVVGGFTSSGLIRIAL
ncbi:MAG: DUF4249 family protein [Bacteroidota bacterium]